jgi:hypothetical protein
LSHWLASIVVLPRPSLLSAETALWFGSNLPNSRKPQFFASSLPF